MPTMHTTTYTSVFSGQNVGPSFPQYNSFTISGNIALSWPSGFQNLNPVVAVNMDISATAGGFTVQMPDAEDAGTGYAIKINNPGVFSFNLIDNANNLIVTIPGGTTKEIWLIDNSTPTGTWRTFPNPGGGSAITSINAASASNNLIVTGTPGLPITSAGTINFSLANDLLALTSFGASTGIPVRTAANSWALRSINGTVGQIIVTNPSGVAGNMTISLSNVLTNLVSIGVGNLSLALNTISSTNANGNIIISPQGTGRVQISNNTDLFSGSELKFWNTGGTFYTSFASGTTTVNQTLFWPTTVPANGQVLSHTAFGQLAWASIPTTGGGTTILNSIARYSNTGGSLTDSIITIDNAGNISGARSAQINNVLISTLGPATISTQLTDQDLTFQPNGIGLTISRTDLLVRKNAVSQSKLRLYNNADNFYAGIMANASMAASVTWTLPIAGNTEGFFYTDATNTMSVIPMTAFLPTGTLNAVPRYSNTIGSPLKDSLFVISDAGAGTGLTSLNIANIAITSGSVTSAGSFYFASATSTSFSASLFSVNAPTWINDTTASTSPTSGALRTSGGLGVSLKAYIGGALNVTDTTASSSVSTGSGIFSGGVGIAGSAFIGGTLSTSGDASLLPNGGVASRLRLYNTAGTFYTAFKTGAAGSNTTYTIPNALPASKGYMQSDTSGNLSFLSISTVANQLAKYSDTVGTVASSTAYLDANSNFSLGVGSGSFPASLVNGILLANGSNPTTGSMGTTFSMHTKGSGVGGAQVLCLSGAVSCATASTSSTVTNKICIAVNGTTYYLLASTSSA